MKGVRPTGETPPFRAEQAEAHVHAHRPGAAEAAHPQAEAEAPRAQAASEATARGSAPRGTAVDRLATGNSGIYYGLSEAVALYHRHFGCIVCEHRGPECTPTLCRTEAAAA